jgi:hypothetical protein
MRWLLLVLGFTACSGGGDDDDDGMMMSAEYFRATVDGAAFEAESPNIAVVLSNFGSGTNVQVSAAVANDDRFTLIVPTFEGEITRSCADDGTLLRYTGTSIVECSSVPFGSGTITIRKTAGDVDVYQGTFSGSFEDPVSHQMVTISGGEFLAERLL